MQYIPLGKECLIKISGTFSLSKNLQKPTTSFFKRTTKTP